MTTSITYAKEDFVESESTRKWPGNSGTKVKTGFLTSKDGTIIGYRELGNGPGIVILHGAMESSQSHTQLAESLADSFTVYLPDRRGRGLSGSYSDDYCAQREVEDLDAVLNETGAHNVFGVSAGGDIVLLAALTLPSIHKVAVYEPALVINGSISMDFLTRYDNEMAQGEVAAALITAMKGAHMGPPMLNVMPRWLLQRLSNKMMVNEDKKAKPEDVTMRNLAPTLHYDFKLVMEASEKVKEFGAIQTNVLLLGGSKSPAYLKAAIDHLQNVLPNFRRLEFPGLNHGGSGPTKMGGKPQRVARELRRFFV